MFKLTGILQGEKGWKLKHLAHPSLDDLFLHTSLDKLDNILVKMIHQVCEVSLMRVRAESFSSNPVHIVFPWEISKLFL